MPHVLVAGKLHPSGIALLKARADVTFDYVEEISEPSYAPLIGAADGLVIRTQPLSADTVRKADRLRIVSRHGVGYDAVDLPSLNDRGIALAVCGDVNSVSVAEQAMMLLLAAAKRAVRSDRAVRTADWGWRNRLEQGELWGKRLLVVGYGRSGRHLARMASGFDMEIRAFDPFLARHGWPEGPVAPVAELAEGLAWADFVSVHAPKTDKPVIAAAELAVMKPSAILDGVAWTQYPFRDTLRIVGKAARFKRSPRCPAAAAALGGASDAGASRYCVPRRAWEARRHPPHDHHPRAHEAVLRRRHADRGGRSLVVRGAGGRSVRPAGSERRGQNDDDSHDRRPAAAGRRATRRWPAFARASRRTK